MGAVFAPTIANLYVSNFESQHILTTTNPYQNNILKWLRYIDDVLLIWKGESSSLTLFHTWLNGLDPNLKFSLEQHNSEISFLDLKIIAYEGVIHTSLFTKPTARNTLLKYNSHHPSNLKNNLPYGQFLRLRRNCSKKDDYFKEAKILSLKLRARGYPSRLVRRSLKRAWYSNREALLQPNTKTQNMKLICVSTFGTLSNKIKKCILKHWPLLNNDRLFLEKPRFAFKRGTNLRDKLIKAYHEPKAVSIASALGLPPLIGHFRCGHCKACETCLPLKSFSINNVTGLLRHFSNCGSKNVIYCISCPCGLNYIGKTTQEIRKRILQHQSKIRCKTENAPLVEHYISLNHKPHEMKWWVVELIKSSVRHSNIDRTLAYRENRWIWSTDNVRHGLNVNIEWMSLATVT